MIILINGTINAGKTTVAKMLAAKLPRTAHIEKLRQFIEWMSIEESVPYNIKNIISLTRNFITLGNLNVVISYPISSKHFRMLTQELADLNTPIHAFTLAPDLETIIRNRGTRELASWEVEQIKKAYAENFHKPEYGIVIDNTNQTPEETLQIISNNIGV